MLNVDGTNTMALIRDVQRDIMKGNLIHIDFQELTQGEKIRVKIPVHIINKNLVEDSVSVVQEQLSEVEIQTIPKYLPQHIEVDASILKNQDFIKVEDLAVYSDENIEVLTDESQVIALLTNATREEVAVAEEKSLADLY